MPKTLISTILIYIVDNFKKATHYIVKDLFILLNAIKDFIIIITGFISFTALMIIYIPYLFISSFIFFYFILKRIEEPYKRRCRIILDSKEKMLNELKELNDIIDNNNKLEDVFDIKILRKNQINLKKIISIKKLIKEL